MPAAKKPSPKPRTTTRKKRERLPAVDITKVREMVEAEQAASPRGIGRPKQFKPEYIEVARRLAQQLGATDPEIAEFLGVSLATVSNWKLEYPEFLEATKIGKEVADDRVAKSLYHRALGYSHPEDDIRAVDGQIVITPTIKHYPPDTTAAIFWLKNRRPEEFRDKVDVNHGLQPDNPLGSLLERLAGTTVKAVKDGEQ